MYSLNPTWVFLVFKVTKFNDNDTFWLYLKLYREKFRNEISLVLLEYRHGNHLVKTYYQVPE